MNLVVLMLAAATPAADPLALPGAPAADPLPLAAPADTLTYDAAMQPGDLLTENPTRGLFQSDHAFDGFVGPISNPILSKDPRSNTYARLLFVNNNFPGQQAFGGGNAQVYAMQVNLALTDRLSIIADKDGLANFSPKRAPSSYGILNLAAGLKYTFYRDVENQAVAAVGLQYEIPSGEKDAYSGYGSGMFTPFVSWGKEFGDGWHALGTHGLQVPADAGTNATFLYSSFHLDKRIGSWFYPLAELNWFQYTSSGNVFPAVVGEGDGLLNLGTREQSWKQLLTAAVGAKAVISQSVIAGLAYEFPLSNYKGILNNRITAEIILRY